MDESCIKIINHHGAPPFPTLTKLCDSLRSRAVDQSRIALELEEQYQTLRTGLSPLKPHVVIISSLELPNLKPTLYHCHIPGSSFAVGRESI